MTIPEAVQILCPAAIPVAKTAPATRDSHMIISHCLQSHDEQDDDEHESEEQDEGTDKMSVSMLASSSAAFWQRMLRLRWDRLQAEEAEALLEQEIPPIEGGEDDASGALQHLVIVSFCLQLGFCAVP